MQRFSFLCNFMKYLMKNVLLRYLVNAMQNQVRSINRVSAIDRSITIDVLAMPRGEIGNSELPELTDLPKKIRL